GQPRSGAPRPRPGGWTQRPALTHRSRPRAATPRREAARPQRRLRGDPASDSRSARAVEGTVRPTGRYPGGTSRCEEPGGQIMTTNPSPFAVVVVSAGVSDPSSTKLLAQQTAGQVATIAGDHGHEITTTMIDLRELANEVTSALVSRLTGP